MTNEDAAASPLDGLAAAMAAVLDRCVWSQGMTHASLVPYLVEECYELVEAIEAGGRDELVEELGDVLWQVAFHSEIAARSRGEDFDVQDVAARVTEKMVRRHPHVFGDETARTPEEVLRLWNAAKAAEKGERRSALDGVPFGMPALALADKVLGRAERAGVALPAPAAGEEDDLGDEAALGARLLALVAAARARGLDAERALRGAVRGLRDAVRESEAAGSRGRG